MKNQFESNIIQGFKTYDYLGDKRSMKFGDYYKPKINIQDAIKQRVESSKEEYIIGKKRDNFLFEQHFYVCNRAFNILFIKSFIYTYVKFLN